MNRRWYLTLPAVALAIAFACLAPQPPAASAQSRSQADLSPFAPAPYRVGERLSYNVSFSNFTTAAHVELLVAGRGQHFGREGLELRARVETMGVVSAALYAVNNDYASFVDPATGAPYRLRQVIREGARAADLGTVIGLPSAAALPSGQESTPAAGAFDLVSALYRIRALPLTQGATYSLLVQHNSVPYQVELRVVGRELVKTNIGSSNAIVTQVRVPGNGALNDYRLRIYFSDDELHVPLALTARHRAGEIRAELASVEILTEVPPASAPGPPVTQANPPGGQPIPIPPQAGGTGPVMPTPSSTTAGSETGAPTPAEPPADLPFKVGEQLNFNFFAGTSPQPVGTANFHVRARARYFNRDGLLLTAQLQTAGAGQALFPVSDQINSYVDAGTLVPFRTELRLQEGKRRSNWVVSVDQNLGNALFDEGTRVDIPAGTHDLLSVFYALRSFDLTPGRQNRVSLLLNKRQRLLSVTALRRGQIELGGQRIQAVELALMTSDQEGDRFSLRLWVSTDSRRLPLRLTAQTPIGPVRADLAIIPTALQ